MQKRRAQALNGQDPVCDPLLYYRFASGRIRRVDPHVGHETSCYCSSLKRPPADRCITEEES